MAIDDRNQFGYERILLGNIPALELSEPTLAIGSMIARDPRPALSHQLTVLSLKTPLPIMIDPRPSRILSYGATESKSTVLSNALVDVGLD